MFQTLIAHFSVVQDAFGAPSAFLVAGLLFGAFLLFAAHIALHD